MISLCTTLLKLQLICLVSPEFLNECGYKDGVCEGKYITQVVWSIFDHLPGYRCPGSEYSLKYNGPYTYYVITLEGWGGRTMISLHGPTNIYATKDPKGTLPYNTML